MLRIFSLSEQLEFAILSGDWNPIHCSPLAARRLLFGMPTVHGAHLVLWALDRLASQRPGRMVLSRLEAEFLNPVTVDRQVELRLDPEEHNGLVVFEIRSAPDAAGVPSAQGVYARIRFRLGPLDSISTGASPQKDRLPQTAPDTLSADALEEYRTSLFPVFPPEHAESLFPQATSNFPSSQLAEILSASRLVGMHCPGELSLFSALTLDFSGSLDGGAPTHFTVSRWDARFSRLTVQIDSPRAKGSLTAFRRPPLPVQKSLQEVRSLIERGEFEGQSALIIGGSRGLGEVIAKLLAAGGASVDLTYNRGRDDAERVAGELGSGGVASSIHQLDVLDREKMEELVGSLPAVTHCYFLATPPLAQLRADLFSHEQFVFLARYYVDAFAGLARAVARLGGTRAIFYPSTAFLEQLPTQFVEYTAAKAAGEQLCAFLNRHLPTIRIYAPRLPRLATDLSAGLISTGAEEPASVLLPLLRSFHSGTQPPSASLSESGPTAQQSQ